MPAFASFGQRLGDEAVAGLALLATGVREVETTHPACTDFVRALHCPGASLVSLTFDARRGTPPRHPRPSPSHAPVG